MSKRTRNAHRRAAHDVLTSGMVNAGDAVQAAFTLAQLSGESPDQPGDFAKGAYKVMDSTEGPDVDIDPSQYWSGDVLKRELQEIEDERIAA